MESPPCFNPRVLIAVPSPDNDVNAPRPAESAPAEPTPHRRRVRLPRFDLSLTQLVATGLAAITATVAASFLGVTGTVIGAALASMTTAAGNAVYGQSLRRGRDRVRDATRTSSHPRTAPTDPGPTAPARPTPARPVPARAAVTPPADSAPDLPAPGLVRPVVWKRAAFGAVTVFVAVLAVVTGVEIVAGRPLADVVRGDSGSGTSFFGTAPVRTRTVTPAAPPTSPATTTTVTVTPKVVVTTPTVTQTAPTRTETATPSTTVTTTLTPTVSGSATDSPSRSASTPSAP